MSPRYRRYAHHLRLDRADLKGAKIALLPGDPARSAAIARYLEGAEKIVESREFVSHRGRVGKTRVLVTSTGCGAPSTALCVEELAQLGVDTFIRVGSCGSIQTKAKIGELAIAQAAVRLEGASKSIAPIEYPAVADLEVTQCLIASARRHRIPFHVGITASTDTFHQGQERYDSFTGYVPRHLRGSIEEYRALKVLNFEMEAAVIFVMASAMGLRAGSVCGIVANRTRSETLANTKQFKVAEHRAIRTAVDSVRFLP